MIESDSTVNSDDKSCDNPSGGTMQVGPSFSQVTERFLSTNKRNVLEVVLEKDERGSFTVSETDCAKLLYKLGFDMRPGAQVEGLQICPNGRGVLYITLKDHVDISKYCRYDVIDVTNTGIRATLIKPAGKRESVVTLKGVHPTTADNVIIDYMEKFGKLVSKKIIYGTFSEGPLKGIKNGDRCLKMELMPDNSLGSYHLIEGQRVTIRYAGQLQTCARCLKSARDCKGKGVAKRCEAAGGEKTSFALYISNLWSKIGYVPSSSEGLENSLVNEIQQQVGGEFTPLKVVTSPRGDRAYFLEDGK